MIHGIRILCVEDDPCHEALEREGAVLEAARTAAEALEILAVRPPDAALVDGSGIDLIREARAKGSDVPFVVVTAGGAPEHAVAALQAGAQEYLVKPIPPEALVEALRRALAAVHRQRELGRLWAEIARIAMTPGLWNRLREIAEPDPPPEGEGLIETVERVERKMIRGALERTGWVKARAARALGVTERILSYKMRTLRIHRPGEEQECWNPTVTSASSAS